MNRKLIFPIVFLFGIVTALQAQEPKQKMKHLFNGKNLKGWLVPENNIWWTVEDGALWAKSGPEKRESILWTKAVFENFVLQADFKMGEGTVDSGIFLREEDVQIQIGISGSLKRDLTGSPYIPGKGYPVEAHNAQNVLDTAGWNTMKIEAKGSEFTVWLNGEQVMRYTAEKVARSGPIGLQLHAGNTMTIAFRNIKVAAL